MALGAEQEPLNCSRFWGTGPRHDFTGHLRTIVYLPDRTVGVSTDLLTLLIEEVRLRHLVFPFEAVLFAFTDVDLNALCPDLKQRREALRGRNRRLVGFGDKPGCADQNPDDDNKSHVPHRRLQSLTAVPPDLRGCIHVAHTSARSRGRSRVLKRRSLSRPELPPRSSSSVMSFADRREITTRSRGIDASRSASMTFLHIWSRRR